MEPSPRPDRTVRKLYRALAARCRGKTVLLGAAGPGLAAAIRKRGLEVAERELPATRGLPPGSFGSVVLAGVLESLPEEACPQVLETAWSLLRPGGRLIVSVPNEGCARKASGDPGARAYDRRTLKRLLRPLRRPRLATDQPFRWLVMYSDKPRASRSPVNRTRIDRYRETARLCRGRTIELGCGEGQLSAMIAGRGLEVMGVDLSGEKIRRARAEHPGITFLESDIRTLNLPDGDFDTVVIAEVLEHVGEEAGAEILDRARRLLKPQGRLILSVPNEDCVPHPHHVRQFDRKSLKRLLLPLGRPRMVTAQPYKWLLSYVDRTG
jgi:2-polyprenyl-3-methyl-5-hydroxy-6-metoxy-1,4-benzoquinol methylase